MDLDLLLDNYKNTSFKRRMIFCLLVGMLPATYFWLMDYDNLQLDRESALGVVERNRISYNKNKKKSCQFR